MTPPEQEQPGTSRLPEASQRRQEPIGVLTPDIGALTPPVRRSPRLASTPRTEGGLLQRENTLQPLQQAAVLKASRQLQLDSPDRGATDRFRL